MELVLPAAAPSLARQRASRRSIDWRRAIGQGALLGLIAMALDAGNFPVPDRETPAWLLLVVGSLLLQWSVHGAVLALLAQWTEGRLSAPAMALAFCGVTLALVLLWHAPVFQQLPRPSWWPQGSVAYVVWISLLYGALFATYCLMVQRAARVRALLARATLERARTATEVDQARLQAVEGRVDPALLLRALSAVRQAYRADPTQGERTVDALVRFLRLAMPAVRSGRSTLRTELALLRAHAELRALIDGGVCVCRVRGEQHAGATGFAPLLLVPLVDRLHAAAGDQTVDVDLVARGAAGLTLTLHAPVGGDWLGAELAARLDRLLRRPGAASPRWQAGPSPALTIGLPPAPASTSQERCDETYHG